MALFAAEKGDVHHITSHHYTKTLDEVLTKPPKSGIKWDDVVSLIKKLDGKIKNGSGSRRKFVLMGSVL
ncbi:hypothetical protein PXH59_14330 [Xenorhabdus sp. SF857]|uniref:hypothetical protein n=1 Tax=Xenorhabdus bakwenae TaxID=3026967 RepID=UPI002558261A|nr:hypothetical protein [Xenorhabdus sp. SF857]WFQ81601.1 hypothetical protein PXH59_14330 [Xenorhabdus sp. SF857]